MKKSAASKPAINFRRISLHRYNSVIEKEFLHDPKFKE